MMTPVVLLATEIDTVEGITSPVSEDTDGVAERTELAVAESGEVVTALGVSDFGAVVVGETVVGESGAPHAASPPISKQEQTATSCDTDRIKPSSDSGEQHEYFTEPLRQCSFEFEPKRRQRSASGRVTARDGTFQEPYCSRCAGVGIPSSGERGTEGGGRFTRRKRRRFDKTVLLTSLDQRPERTSGPATRMCWPITGQPPRSAVGIEYHTAVRCHVIPEGYG
ncbi:hypothetical protein [Nocardia gipuzkoensis]|uniref:hypothetical protein n=1 Tax=Nocardia gipuzkoensis TaxID=2749991 RepID=UPI00237DB849|nr:hypothetical protein [Nocardia gipuzkoensis]MDE1674374.1 hypothetical protein [Nocardia gipuzkoensis]